MTTRQKAVKLIKKDYHLKNEKTGQFITVFPPTYPGDKPEADCLKDSKNQKNKAGEWIRQFHIKNTHGVKAFEGQTHVTLTHLPRHNATCEINGEKWSICLIEKEPVAAKAIKETKAPAKAESEKATDEPIEAEVEAKKPKTMMEEIESNIKAGAVSAGKHAKLKSKIKAKAKAKPMKKAHAEKH